MIKRLRRRVMVTLLLLAALLFIACDLLLLWVATGPRSINVFTPYIERALAMPDGNYSTKIGETWLTWGNWRHPIDIRLRAVNIITKEGAVFSSFPEISIGIDLLALPFGKILPTSITLEKPEISLFQNEDKSINFGFGKPESLMPSPGDQTLIPTDKISLPAPATVPFSALLAPLMSPESGNAIGSLRRITIRGTSVVIGNVKKGIFFEITDADIKIRKHHDTLGLFISGTMHYSDRESFVSADMVIGKDLPTIDGSIQFRTLDPGALAKLFIDDPAFRIFNAPLSGSASVSLTKDGAIQRIAFNADGGGGYIHSEHLADSIPINALHIAGEITNNASDIKIDALSITMEKTVLSGSGTVSLANNDAAIRAHLAINNVPARDVKLFWPPALSQESRAWVLENITEGTIPQASADININFGDLIQPTLPRKAVNASIALENATIRYLPEHPNVTKVRGNIYIDGVSLTANITSGSYMQSTAISQGNLQIDDLNADNPYIKLAFNADSNARDIVRFLELPRLQRAARLNLNADTAHGTASAYAELGFYFYAPMDAHGKSAEPDINYNVTATVKDIAQPGFLRKFDIAAANGTFKVDKRGVTFNGSGIVNGAHASQAEVAYLFAPEAGIDTFIDVTATAPVDSLPRFGYPALTFASGSLSVKASVKLGEEQEHSSASITLDNTALNVKSLDWIKPLKEPARIEIAAEKKNGAVNITSFTLSGKDVEAAGTAALSKDFDNIERLSLKKTIVGKTHLDYVNYEKKEGAIKLEAAGKSADLSGWLDTDEETSDFSFKHFPALQFNVDIKQLMISKRGVMSDVKGDMRCDAKICTHANISGTVAENKTFNFRILRNPKGKRQMSLHATDAGAFLKAIGAFPNVESGDLAITGNYDESSQGSVLKGRATVTEYTVKKAPVLAKILSLASLTGVVDLMQGNGIRFTKLSIPFTLKDDVFTFTKARAYGSSIGIATNGTMTFPKRTLDLDGTVVPAYALNNIVGKIPLVGGILTGGEGIFAFSYTVKGTESNPDVSVNPLSILAPGFLRGLFEGADKDNSNE